MSKTQEEAINFTVDGTCFNILIIDKNTGKVDHDCLRVLLLLLLMVDYPDYHLSSVQRDEDGNYYLSPAAFEVFKDKIRETLTRLNGKTIQNYDRPVWLEMVVEERKEK